MTGHDKTVSILDDSMFIDDKLKFNYDWPLTRQWLADDKGNDWPMTSKLLAMDRTMADRRQDNG